MLLNKPEVHIPPLILDGICYRAAIGQILSLLSAKCVEILSYRVFERELGS
jgi:hypothetical protein